MALSISTPTSSSLLPASRQVGRWNSSARSAKPATFSLRRSVLAARAAGGNVPSSPVSEVVTELDAVASFSEIVPDTVVFDDFEKFAPTAATVSSSLLLGITGLPDTKFKSTIDTALADGECNTLEKPEDRMSCFLTKALANVGAELAHLVPGRVSTEIDARLAYDTQGIIQRVIAINNQFPGPLLNVTTNWNVRVNVQNNLDEPLLLTWDGIQMRMDSWQDGVAGTNCPIPPGWNWTYQFQLKDQIGSFFYFPSLGLQRAAGGYGPVTVNNRAVVPVPFDQPDGDITLFIGDWYTKSHIELRNLLDDGKDLGIPHGIVINGKGPYRYNTTLVPEGLQYEIVGVEPGKTYRFRVHNVGTSTSLNFRIQNHNMRLVEAEGTYTNQQNYTDLDIHVGQSYSFLVTMDQNASTDYYIVASPRFVSEPHWHEVSGVAILQYSNSKGSASGPLPDAPNDFYYKYYSMNQARSIRTNLSSGAARPNPQGSFRYGSINITQTFVLKNESPLRINGKRRRTINRISYSPPETPLRLADLHNLTGVYQSDFPTMPSNAPPRMASSALNASYKGFLEIVFQNNDTDVQTYHLDGYSFFVVGMDYGEWTPDSRGAYNKWDAIFRSTTQVFPGGWTAVLVSLDNVGIWNLRSENLDNWYNGQEVYVKVADPLGYNITEIIAPDNILYCGLLKDRQTPQIHQQNKSSAQATARWSARLPAFALLIIAAVIFS